MPANPTKPPILVDGQLADWIASERIDYGDISGYSFYAQAQDSNYYFALAAPIVVGANTTFWFNTDRNTATGYQIFGFAGGAEYNVNIKSDGTAALYSGGAGQTLVLDNILIAYSADHKQIEFAIPKTAIGTPGAIDTLYDVNDTVYAPSNYSAQPYVAYNNDIVRTDPAHKIAIVYSATTAAQYFSQTAYSQLFMAVQSQAMQAGISFDLINEGDLTNVAKLANYDTIVFPSFANVQASQVTAIANALLQVTKQFGVGLITAGNFMTNDETGAALAGDSYARMKLLFDATRVTGGFPADVTVTSSDASQTVFKTMNTGTVIHNYKGVAWDAFQSVSGTGQTIATETVGGQTYAAALATQTGGKNVLFSTQGVMADNNLLWQAIDYTANNPGISVDLEISRFKGIVASRTDMDQAMYTDDVSPGAGQQGIYDKLLPILAQWKQQYDFVGSYYIDIGDNAAAGETTNWAVSAPYYAQLLSLGNELGTHSLTHPENTNVLTPAQIQNEFQQSKLIIEQQMSAYLGKPFTVSGAAVPGATETLPTSKAIIQYFDYITGGFSGVGSGYPGAFGYLSSDLTSSVYLAPNTSFDFTLADYQKLGAAGASTAWAAEWNQLTVNAALPIVLWPWHDYGPTLWQTDAPNASPYSLQMFTDWIQRAYQSGVEFVTEADLAGRIKSFDTSGVTSSVSGNTVSATVTSSHASNFALDIVGIAGQVIKSVANWYAYDSDQLFLPETGGSYTITLGTSEDDVTHIAALPMRGDLLSVTGDGLNIAFSMVGEGDVTIALGAVGDLSPVVTGSGAAIASRSGDQLVVRLTGLGQHDVSVRMLPPSLPPPTETVSTVAFSADTGASATDLVTNTAAQTITGTLSAPLATGDVVQVSLDNGTTWSNASVAGGTTFSLSGVVLAGSNTLIARVANSGGVTNTPLSRSYVLDTATPAEAVAITAMTLDTGTAGDFITSDGAAGRTVSGTLSTTVATGETLRVSTDGGATWLTSTVSGTSWSVIDSASHAANWAISAQVIDLAGNLGPLATRAVTLDTVASTAPSVPDLATASDSGVSGTDNLTKVTSPTFTGTADAGATVTLYDGATVIGTAQASSAGAWSIVSSALAAGAHAISARANDAAGNVGAASAALAVTIDTVAPAASSPPDLATASDSGPSSTDNVTNVATPVFTGTAEAGSTVRLLDGTTTIGTATASSTGAWSATATTLANGVHSITAAATDPAGNAGPASTALAVTIDRTAPAAPVLSGGTAQSNSFTLNGSGEAGNTVAILEGATGVGTATVAAGGSWSWQFVTGPTARTFTATQTDKAGNVSAASALMVTGTGGTDALSGGTGDDLFVGGSAADTFSFAGAFGKDIIADFTAAGATHDVISFQASSRLNSFAAVMNRATQVGTSVVIKDTSNTLTLLNVSKSSLTAPDFTFV